jgi:hypothetical protein
MSKYSKKRKFVNRGIYFINDGEYKGSFIIGIKEFDTKDLKAFMLLPDKETIFMSDVDIKSKFNEGIFEYVETIPKKYYKVCVAEYEEVCNAISD